MRANGFSSLVAEGTVASATAGGCVAAAGAVNGLPGELSLATAPPPDAEGPGCGWCMGAAGQGEVQGGRQGNRGRWARGGRREGDKLVLARVVQGQGRLMRDGMREGGIMDGRIGTYRAKSREAGITEEQRKRRVCKRAS